MAIGDEAAAAGMETVPSTKDLRLGHQDINLTRDYIAQAEAGLDARVDELESYKLTNPSIDVNYGSQLLTSGAGINGNSQIIMKAGTVVPTLNIYGDAVFVYPQGPFPNGILTFLLTNGDTSARPNQVVGVQSASTTSAVVYGSGGPGLTRFNYIIIGW